MQFNIFHSFSYILALTALITPITLAKTAAEWRELSIYQLLTDRFATPDGSSPPCWIRDYCGGTWKGLENKLDYIQGMGFEAVWISPIIHNIEGNTTYGYAFHGYWGDNPFELNEHFGTPDDLKSLSNALHARNMSLMVDVVINHLTSNEFAQNIDYSLFPAPFNTPTVFHPSCSIDYANQSSVEDCWLVESPPPVLADLDSENPAVYDPMVQSVVNIVKEYNVDGIRLDTARHIPKPYLAQFQKAVGVFVTGEAVNDSIPYVTQYQGPLNSALNYPLWYALIDAFLGRTTFDYLGSVLRIENIVFEDVNVLGNFLDNHDQPRFASRLGDDVVRDANAVAFLLFTSGIPIVYYGFEQRFDGGYDPVNRAPLWESGYNTEASLYQYIAALHKVRGLAAGIMGKSRYFATKTVVLGTSDTHMAFERGPLVVVVSNVGMDGVETPYMVSKSQFGSGVNLVDLLSCTTRKTSKDGSFLNPVHGGRPRIWLRARDKGSYCP